MKKLAFLALALTVLTGCTSITYQMTAPLPGETLSTHSTRATYNGTQRVPCRFMTADCPNACDHGGLFATFTINKYLAYTQPSKYGDEEQKTFTLRVGTNQGTAEPTLSPALAAAMANLQPGDTVTLDWAHVYITDPAGNQYPERVVTRLAH